MQYVILTYMKHLGVKVKEPRGLEHKRARINFLPKIKVPIASNTHSQKSALFSLIITHSTEPTIYSIESHLAS